MFETSQDILNIVKASSVALLSIFICWAIYYFAMIFRQAFRIVKEMRDRLSKFDELMKLIKNKIEHSTSNLILISEGVKKLVEVIKAHAEKKGNKKTTRRKKTEK